MRARIRTQAYLVSALPLAFLVVLLAIALQIQQESVRAGALEQHTQRALGRMDSIRTSLAALSRAASSYETNPGKSADKPIRAAETALRAEMSGLAARTVGDRGVPARVARLNAVLDRGIALIEHYAALLQAHHRAAARALAAAPSTRALSATLQASYDGVTSAERGLELDELAQARVRTFRYEVALIVVCLLAIALTLFVSGRFGLRIAKRLEHLAQNARRLARGEPAAELRGDDEFAALDRVYQTMMLRIAREHRISSTLQKMLLPQRLPQIEGVRIDSVYVPAAEDAEVGGDWYDVFAISPDRICISIGDVAGHGLRAATVMAGARLAMRTAARIDARPASIMAHVNRIVCEDEPEVIVSAVVAILDLRDGSLRYSVAGHPEPIVIRGDGEIEFLPGKGLVLGADSRAVYDTFETIVDEGFAILLYTDGVVEIEHDYFKGIEELAAAARSAYSNASTNIAEEIQRAVAAGRHPQDDAALLFIAITSLSARAARTQRRNWSFDARDAASARRTKRAALWYLGETIRDQDELAAAELILGELLGNVARHSPGPAEVSVDLAGDAAILRVRDRGEAFHPNSHAADPLAESGRGLFLVRAMAREVNIENDGRGNSVTATLHLGAATA